MDTKLILLIEDNTEIQHANKKMLELAGYAVETAMDLHTARQVMLHHPPDLLILDIMMPDGSGFDFCRDVRENSDIPILFLTALGEKDAVVQGLRVGGDDYLAKPFDYDELLARIEALFRRAERSGTQERALHIDTLEINLVSRRALLNDRDLLLTPKEFAVLETLARRQGEYISAKELYAAVWGLPSLTDTRTVKEHVYRLRRKLGHGASVHIESVAKDGYRLVVVPC